MDDQQPQSVDLAIGWLQHGIDELADATRRTRDLAIGPAVGAAPPGTAAADATSATPPEFATADASAPPTDGSVPPAATSATSPSTTPLLDKIGRDLTLLAKQGELSPLIGREAEMQWIIEVLCRTEKRNPVLLGAAGAGKTAIVEGLAQRIASGNVPKLLQGDRLIEIPLAGLVAGTQYRGQLEDRVQQLIAEASQPGIILFFDEIHLLEGAGQSEGGIGAGEALKPALARGDIAVIGATTPEEWRATIEKDDALARRFTTIAITELDKDATRPILRAVRDGLAKARGVTVSDDALDTLLDFADTSILNRRFPDKAIDLLQQAVAEAIVDGRTTVSQADAVATTKLWAERATSTPTLERFGRDLIQLAKDGKLGPIVGRDQEIDAVIQVLLRHSKRDPLLLGPAGAGKTAIVEGLAIRMASGKVPVELQGVHIFDIPLIALAQGMSSEPTLLSDFLMEARHPSIIIFFDEIHTLALPDVKDLAESLKPALARGDIACIGATTGEEYQALLEPEAALARRFTQIAVEPMDDASVRQVLISVAASLGKLRGVTVEESAIDDLIALADQFLPNRAFPDKGVDVIEQSVAYAITHGRKVVDSATAREAMAAFVGMPLDPTEPLATLASDLPQRGLIDPASADTLVARLRVSLRGLDSNRQRPDAVILLCGAATSTADSLAALLASTLFGRATAVISIDLSGMSSDEAASSLLGSAPGLIGSDRPLPLQELRRAPWQVVLFDGIDRCAASIRETIAAALESGTFTDAMGRQIPLGSTIVIATAPTLEPGAGGPADLLLLGASLGPSLLAQCDVVTGLQPGVAAAGRSAWISSQLLAPLADRFGRQGFKITFDPIFVDWVDKHLPTDGGSPEAFLDHSVTPQLAAGLSGTGGSFTAVIKDDQPALVAANRS